MPATVPTGQQVADYLGVGDDAEMVTACQQKLDLMLVFVANYTRRRGFDADGVPAPDLAAVAVTAAAREVNVAERVGLKREEVGSYSVLVDGNVGYGFTLREIVAMQAYRRMSA